MTHVSKIHLSKTTWKSIWNQLIIIFDQSSKAKDTSVLINNLLTDTEQIMIAKRLMVAVLTYSDWDTDQIASTLKLTPPTIYKFRHQYHSNPEYQRLISATFPKKVSPPHPKPDQSQALSDLGEFLGDIFAGYHDRSRLFYGKIPKGR